MVSLEWNNRTNFNRNLVVVIGIDQYNHDHISNLSTPVSDADAFADLLETEFEYKPEYVLRLTNDQANLTGLRTLLNDTLPNHINPTESDRLIFYFAGHGLPINSDDGPQGYLVPQDADPSQVESFLSMNEVSDALNKLQCHHLLVILDCCFAGTFRWASSRKAIVKLEKIYREHYDRFIRFPARQLITSSAHDQEALDIVKLHEDQRGKVDDQNHSPFALSLLKALKNNNADYTKDGVITAHELIIYLEEEVSKLTNKRQVPGLYPLKREYDKGEFIFVQCNSENPFDPSQLSRAPELNEENNPYRGLKPFEERHSQFFFGRKKLVEKLSDRLANPHHPLTVVVGMSGSGKSSLVKAGLLPDLRKKNTEAPAKLCYILDPMRPGKSPFAELAKTLLPIANSNLIANLSQIEFLDQKFKDIFNSQSGHKQQGVSQPSASPDSQDVFSGDLVSPIKIAKSWDAATQDKNDAAKLGLLVNYFNQLKEFCDQEQQKQLSDLHDQIKQTLKHLHQSLQKNPEYFAYLMEDWSQSNPGTKLLLVIDQFEELVTMNQDNRGLNEQYDSQEQYQENQSQKFLLLLSNTLRKYDQQLQIIVTLRSDFEPQFLNSPLKDYWKDSRFQLQGINSAGGMNFDELREVIEGPALRQALYFEPPKLVDQLIYDVGQMPGALPLLSLTLSELYIKLYQRWIEDQSTDRALRMKDYEKLGGVANALTSRATQEYENLIQDFGEESGKAYQATMKRVMLRMVTIELGGIARRRVLMDELEYPTSEENHRVAIVIERLVKARLLVKGQETEKSYVEPSHDFLVREWNVLNKWIAEEKAFLILQQRLTPAANDWKQNRGNLWTEEDGRLLQLRPVINSEQNWLNKVETEFVYYSIEERRKRLEAQEKQRDETLQINISGLTALSETGFQDDQLGALIHILTAGRIVQQLRNSKSPWRQEDIILNTEKLMLKTLIKVEEFNRLNFEDIIDDISVLLEKKIIATKDYQRNVQFWTLEGEKISFDIQGASAINFSPKGNAIAVAVDNQVILLNLENQEYKILELANDYRPVYALALSPNGKMLATASYDAREDKKIGKLEIWNTEDGQLKTQLGDLYMPMAVAFSPDNQMVGVTGWQSPVIYRIDGSWHKQLEQEGSSTIAFSPDGQMIATGATTKIKLWNIDGTFLKDVNEQIAVNSNSTNTISSVAFSPDGQMIASGEQDTTVKLWNLNGQLLKTLRGHQKPITKVEFIANDIVVSASNDKTVRIWNLNYNRTFHKILDDHSDIVYAVGFSPDGKIIATTTGHGYIQLWQTNGKLLKKAQWQYGLITKLDFSPDGKLIIIAAGDRTLRLSKADGTESILLEGHTGEPYHTEVLAVLFSPDSQKIASGSVDGKIEIWSRDGKLLRSIQGHNHQVRGISFSPNGKIIASVSLDGTVKLWDSEYGLPVDMLQSDLPLLDVAFSSDDHPDNQIIAVARRDGKISLWNPNTGVNVNIQAHDDVVTSLRFSPNNQLIATASYDRRVKLWNRNGTLQRILYGHNDFVNTVAFSPDGKILASVSNDKTAILWNLNLEIGLDQLIDYGCEWICDYLTKNPNVSESDQKVLSSENFPPLKYESQKWKSFNV